MSTRKTYFITGASRPDGVGFNLARHLASEPDTLVFATARDLAVATELTALAKERENVYALKLEATSKEDAQRAVESVQQKTDHLDVLIPCAAVCPISPLFSASLDDVRNALEVNTLGPLQLFQAFWPLLSHSARPVFAPISSGAGSITFSASLPFPMGAYGLSKCALNYLAAKLAGEHPELCSFTIHPGRLATGMTREVMKVWPEAERVFAAVGPADKMEESVEGIARLVKEAQRESHGGKFFNHDGQEMPW